MAADGTSGAVVTGGGRASARRPAGCFAARGRRRGGARPRRGRAPTVADEVGGTAVLADVTDPAAVAAASTRPPPRLGGLTDVVSNAGIGRWKPLHELHRRRVAAARRRQPVRRRSTCCGPPCRTCGPPAVARSSTSPRSTPTARCPARARTPRPRPASSASPAPRRSSWRPVDPRQLRVARGRRHPAHRRDHRLAAPSRGGHRRHPSAAASPRAEEVASVIAFLAPTRRRHHRPGPRRRRRRRPPRRHDRPPRRGLPSRSAGRMRRARA